MKKNSLFSRLAALVLLAALLLSLTGCSSGPKTPDYSKGDSAAFVKAAARAVTTRVDGPELFYAGEDAYVYDLAVKPTLQPYLAMLRFQAKTDPEDPELVHYSCKIPGLVGTCFNMAYGVCFMLNEKYSKWVDVEGELRVITDEDGSRRIDISQGDNVFAVYAALRYINPLFFQFNGIDISKGISDEDFSSALNILLNRGCEAYAQLLGVPEDEYAQEVVIPELEDYSANIATVALGSTCKGYGYLNYYAGMSPSLKITIFVVGGFLLLLGLYALVVNVVVSFQMRKEKKQKRKRALPRDLLSNDRDASELLDGLAHDSSGFRYSDHVSYCSFMQKKPAKRSEKTDFRDAARMAAVLAEKPDSAEVTEATLRFLCRTIHLGSRIDPFTRSEEGAAKAFRHELLTAAGWSAAALGRLLARKMKPEDIPANLERLSPALDRSNEDVDKMQELLSRRDALSQQFNALAQVAGSSIPAGSPLAGHAQQLQKEYKELEEKIESLELETDKGIGGYMLDNGDLPLAYLVFLLRDSQNRYPRFIKQGVIMGLVDWLAENRNIPEAAELLQTLVSVRADMIRSDNELSFFEVRVPERTTRKDYALLLKDVLHCANPAMSFCNTEELLSIAEKEVPGCMDMLYACPLRLIDPANRRTLGFYQFKPYVHAMWVQFIPPLKTGTVISRYHEVDDRTKPLSSGLNLQLFRDCYAVIPTLFHEYQHFRGDPNEASVFLKTQLFSISFYKKHPQANAKADGVFAQLTTLLGLPPAADKRTAFNNLIERYYGKQLSFADAQRRAAAELASLNAFIDGANAQETWDPDKKLPRLSDEEDKRNQDLIRDIVIRFATVPKSITAEEFESILKGKDVSLQATAGMPFSRSLNAIANKFGKKEGIDMWLNELLAMALGGKLGLEGMNTLESGSLNEVLEDFDLDAANCKLRLEERLFDRAVHDPKNLSRYLRLAAKQARAMESLVIKPEHLLYALLKHPTATMRNAGIR